MKIIVDTNIVFSAVLNSSGKIGHIIINGSKFFNFFSVNLLKKEIINHKNKILEISQLNESQFNRSYNLITSRIKFFDEVLLSDKDIEKSLALVADIDENDALFVALTNHLDGKLWTGDKKLISGLKKKNYFKVLSTDELYEIFMNIPYS